MDRVYDVTIREVREKTVAVKASSKEEAEKIKNILKDQSGMSVIELLLILVGILTPYYGVSIKCIT